VFKTGDSLELYKNAANVRRVIEFLFAAQIYGILCENVALLSYDKLVEQKMAKPCEHVRDVLL